VAAFANGHLTVGRDVNVLPGGTAKLGYFASSFPCIDDPNQTPKLNGPVSIGRDLIANAPLGVLMHDGTAGRDVRESGGGGGVTCTPEGIFAVFDSPVYSDYEDSTVGRDFSVTGLQSCWFGTFRVNVGRDLSYVGNTFFDPDASEVHTNMVDRDISCSANSPKSAVRRCHQRRAQPSGTQRLRRVRFQRSPSQPRTRWTADADLCQSLNPRLIFAPACGRPPAAGCSACGSAKGAGRRSGLSSERKRSDGHIGLAVRTPEGILRGTRVRPTARSSGASYDVPVGVTPHTRNRR
jgi:hypothetical protein